MTRPRRGRPGAGALANFGRKRRRDADNIVRLDVLVPPGPEVMWAATRHVGRFDAFSAIDLALAARCSPEDAEDYLFNLNQARHVVTAMPRNGVEMFRLADKPPFQAPFLDHRGHEDYSHELTRRVWLAVKMVKRFTLTSLLAAMHDDEFPAPKDSVAIYIRALARAGYLDEFPAEQACGEKQYRIVGRMISGPLPPRLVKIDVLFDPNRQAIAGRDIVAETVRL
jgi:hypothetical protein